MTFFLRSFVFVVKRISLHSPRLRHFQYECANSSLFQCYPRNRTLTSSSNSFFFFFICVQTFFICSSLQKLMILDSQARWLVELTFDIRRRRIHGYFELRPQKTLLSLYMFRLSNKTNVMIEFPLWRSHLKPLVWPLSIQLFCLNGALWEPQWIWKLRKDWKRSVPENSPTFHWNS